MSDNIPVELHRKYARKARDYMRAYKELGEGGDAMKAQLAVKQMKARRSKRSPPPHESDPTRYVPGRKPWAKKRALLAQMAAAAAGA